MPLIPPNRIVAFPLKDDLQWYDPDVVFQPFDDLFGRGVVNSSDLQVVANGGGDGQISVNAGRGYVPYTGGGKKLFKTTTAIRSDAAAEFITAIPAWGGGNPRVHRVIAKILDATLNTGDVYKGGFFDVLPGTATAGANLTNLSGAQAVPANALLLGNVLQNGATIPSGNIDSTFGTVRARARIGAGNSPAKLFQVGGAALTDRSAFNLIAGSGISITAADNAGADSADVTIASTGVPRVIYDSGPIASAQANFDITGIVQTFWALRIFWMVRSTDTAQAARALTMQFNGDTGNNYDGSSEYYVNAGWVLDSNYSSGSNFNIARMPTNNLANTALFGRGVADIVGYSGTTANKNYTADSYWAVSGAIADQFRGISGGRWENSSAITQITLTPGAGNFVAGSRVYIVAF